jgi:hypothetical protein
MQPPVKCERCGRVSRHVEWELVRVGKNTHGSPRYARVGCCFGEDTDEACARAARLVERGAAEDDAAFNKMLAAKEAAPATLSPQALAESVQLLRTALTPEHLHESEDMDTRDPDHVAATVALHAENYAVPLVATDDDRAGLLLGLANVCEQTPSAETLSIIVREFGLDVPDDRGNELARLITQKPGATDRRLSLRASDAPELAEAFGRTVGEQLLENRDMVIDAARTAHDADTYVSTGKPAGAPLTGSHSVTDATAWLSEQCGRTITELRAIMRTRKRGDQQVSERKMLAEPVAHARRSHRFTPEALASALECASRAIQRLIKDFGPPDPFADEIAEERAARKAKGEYTVKWLSPDEIAEHQARAQFIRRMGGKPYLADRSREHARAVTLDTASVREPGWDGESLPATSATPDELEDDGRIALADRQDEHEDAKQIQAAEREREHDDQERDQERRAERLDELIEIALDSGADTAMQRELRELSRNSP